MSKIFNLVYRSVCAGYDYARLQGKNPSMTADLETIANNIVDSLNLAEFEDEATDNQPNENEETNITSEQTNTDEEATETEELPPEAVKDQVSNYLQSLVMIKNEAKHTEDVEPKEEPAKPTYKDELREKLEEKFKQYHEEHPELDHPADEETDTPYFEPVKVETEPDELPSGYTNIMGNSVKNEEVDTPIHPVNEDTIRIEKEDLANITEKIEETTEIKEKNPEENVSFEKKPFIEPKEEQPVKKEKLPEINLESIKPRSESKPVEYAATKKNNIYNDSAFNLTGVIHGIIGSLKSDPRIKNYNQQGYEILPTDLLFLSTHQTNRHLGIILRLIDKKTGKLSYKYVIYELALNNGKGKIYNVTDKFERILPSLDKFTETKANWKAETQELYEKELSEISNAYIKDAFIDEMRSNYMKWLRDQIVYRPTDLTSLFQYMIKKF